MALDSTGRQEARLMYVRIWSERLLELSEFKLKIGHSLVPQSYSPELGQWVMTQRQSSSCIMKKIPVTLQRGASESSRALDSSGIQMMLFGAYDFATNAWIQGAIRPLSRVTQVI